MRDDISSRDRKKRRGRLDWRRSSRGKTSKEWKELFKPFYRVLIKQFGVELRCFAFCGSKLEHLTENPEEVGRSGANKPEDSVDDGIRYESDDLDWQVEKVYYPRWFHLEQTTGEQTILLF